ncbi:MAG: type II toxin-antitoxin system VapC family toxin [Planctomycetes bacterium]|nr:type II toxin-antitoxin system VapC family toxin [Planctomycetota bacterium]
MTTYFADSFYYLALLNRDDAKHNAAVGLSQELRGDQVTTAWVLTEVADAMAAPSQRGHFLTFLARLRANPRVTIVPASRDLFEAGIEFYAQRRDKSWTLTDCISFVTMRKRAVAEALTGDHHFEQAGFVALLK